MTSSSRLYPFVEPIANETWKSFMRSYYRSRLLLLLSSLGEAYLGQLARMLRIPPNRVLALLEGNPTMGYSIELSLIALDLVAQRPTFGRGRAFEITNKGRRKSRSIASGAARRAQRQSGGSGNALASQPPLSAVGATRNANLRWSAEVTWRVTGDASSATWSSDG